MNMRFELYSLIDIENTGARKDAGFVPYSKEQNYLSVLNTISMRANPTIIKSPTVTEKFPVFGAEYKPERAWHMIFEFEYGIHSIEMLENDFQLVPVITGLDETVALEYPVFRTKPDQYKNIIFNELDKY